MKNRKCAVAAALALSMVGGMLPAACAAEPVTATLSNERVRFDGVPCEISAYNISGSNYFMLRDLALILRGSDVQFAIDTDVPTYTIRITTGKAAEGGETAALQTPTAEAAPSDWKLSVDGSPAAVSAFTINGFNFFKLRDLGNAIGFSVAYQAEEHQIDITSEPPAFNCEIAAGEAVAPSWFDDAAFIGDSVSGWLSFYSGEKGLGGATFLTATSLGIENALREVSENSVHPSYQGVKMKAEEAVAKCGAKKVYIMLGMNDISYGVERVTADYVKLIRQIQAASPSVQIYVQSVLPMITTSKRADSKLNNTTIKSFNETMKAACQQNEWYYLDIGSVYADEHGGMRADACADPDGMGLHVTAGATAAWVDYLRTHTPS